jgi:hypothetical protein
MNRNPNYFTDNNFSAYQKAHNKATECLRNRAISVVYGGGDSFKVFNLTTDTHYEVELNQGEVEGATCTCPAGQYPERNVTCYHRMAAWQILQLMPPAIQGMSFTPAQARAPQEEYRVIGDKSAPATTDSQPRYVRFCIECELMPVAHGQTDLCKACILDAADHLIAKVEEASTPVCAECGEPAFAHTGNGKWLCISCIKKLASAIKAGWRLNMGGYKCPACSTTCDSQEELLLHIAYSH